MLDLVGPRLHESDALLGVLGRQLSGVFILDREASATVYSHSPRSKTDSPDGFALADGVERSELYTSSLHFSIYLVLVTARARM